MPPTEKARRKAEKALNFLVGEVLKKTDYKADPAQVRRLMIQELNKPEAGNAQPPA